MTFAKLVQPSLKMERSGFFGRLILGLVLTYSDLVTDLLVALEYFADGQDTYGRISLAFIIIPMVVIAFQTKFVVNQSWIDVLASLFGLKPVLDTF